MISLTPERARAYLRTNFLYGLCEISGEPISITTIEKSTLTGEFKGWKTNGSEILISQLKTPTGERINTSLMRSSDILFIECHNQIELPTRCKIKADPPAQQNHAIKHNDLA